jgi:hypothetical protein
MFDMVARFFYKMIFTVNAACLQHENGLLQRLQKKKKSTKHEYASKE